MVGTVTGFLFMLGTAFENIDVTNTRTLQDALAAMARGMSTALYTTLIGLMSSLIIKVQLVNYETTETQLQDKNAIE
jgi:biopolymer transport protein ExbB/TolQ